MFLGGSKNCMQFVIEPNKRDHFNQNAMGFYVYANCIPTKTKAHTGNNNNNNGSCTRVVKNPPSKTHHLDVSNQIKEQVNAFGKI